ncbi:putative sugar epimerase/reductase [Nocardiopsis alba ATCC BAA-2165]|uniref:Putative sugar epimerase/reductase n=1 Tax=Nocardiopsis alba (strain ATCC BAA-2165 / BE74) TaxID=1205910 RepID=J7L9K3_NOCAA|nr:putative sugar epimerase/reductase [Nocardiopsis alba ATCC BAA-2165]
MPSSWCGPAWTPNTRGRSPGSSPNGARTWPTCPRPGSTTDGTSRPTPSTPCTPRWSGPWTRAGRRRPSCAARAFAASLLEWADQIREGLVRDVFGEARRTLLHERDIAEVAVRVLGEGAHRGERLLLSGPTPLTQVEQVRIIADTLGTRVRFEEVPLDELRSHMRSEGWEDADIEGMITAYAAMVEAEQPVWDTVERITGHPPLGLDRWVLDHEADLR